jgi:hypothetical protein
MSSTGESFLSITDSKVQTPCEKLLDGFHHIGLGCAISAKNLGLLRVAPVGNVVVLRIFAQYGLFRSCIRGYGSQKTNGLRSWRKIAEISCAAFGARPRHSTERRGDPVLREVSQQRARGITNGSLFRL